MKRAHRQPVNTYLKSMEYLQHQLQKDTQSVLTYKGATYNSFTSRGCESNMNSVETALPSLNFDLFFD